MSVREFKLPDVGEGLTEAEIVNWLVAEGDSVEEDQPVAEVETDKAVVEVPAPVDGTVRERRAEPGEMVPVGDVIITFDVAGEDGTAAEAEAEPEPEPEPEDDGEAPTPGGRVFAAPSARRLARELGVDIGAVDGSGPGGRVSDADVRAHAERQEQDDADGQAPEPADAGEVRSAVSRVEEGAVGNGAPPESERADRERTLAVPATRQLAAEHGVDIDAVPTDRTRDGEPFVTAEQVEAFVQAREAAEAEVEPEPEPEPATAGAAEAPEGEGEAEVEAGAETEGPAAGETIPYRGVRRTIGRQMETSKYTAPHVSHHDDVDVTELVELRGELKEAAEAEGVSLTYLPFVVKAVVAGLKQHPVLNSTLDEDAGEIRLLEEYNVGIAVATDAGLMVPVVKGADEKGLLEIAAEINELVARARDRSIGREEMQGGTFTITNFGSIGGRHATPIINYPETAILGLGEIGKQPWVHDGEVVPRDVMGLSLSVDHRVIDGAEAASFANTVKRYLANPSLLLLE